MEISNWIALASVVLVRALAREITACRANPAHFYYRAAATCPWCRMEQQVPGLWPACSP